MKLFALSAATAWLVVLYVATDSAPVSQSVINVTQTQTRHAGVGFSPSQRFGDNDFWLYQIYNKRITQAGIGYSTLRCEYYGSGGVLGAGLSECWAAYSLAKGKVFARGLLKTRSFYQLGISGGTGFYSGIRGQIIVTTFEDVPHKERLLFSIED